MVLGSDLGGEGVVKRMFVSGFTSGRDQGMKGGCGLGGAFTTSIDFLKL